MSSSYGENLKLTIFGQSHSPAVGMTLEGIPAGNRIDMTALRKFMTRRAPGGASWSTPRKEADLPEFLGGIVDDTTCGAPIAAIIRNTNTKSSDYEELKRIPRPGHADLTAQIKYGGFQDPNGGGHFSGRLTAPMCVAGGICRQLLAKEGISVAARVLSVGNIFDEGELCGPLDDKLFPVVNDEQGQKMKELIDKVRADGDSIGGTVECVVTGLPAGIGDPMFDGMENRISRIVFGIPAVKGIEFGKGFGYAGMRGSESNDPYRIKDGKIVTETNNAGGILGGITNGMPLVFRAAFKPTPSIAREQRSVDMKEKKNEILRVKGRHDPCIVVRAVPVVEAAAAIACYDAFLARRREINYDK
ncbi:MAG: chorismate synthase [Lachnospiraceae bacterium]|nr:chorismate synthase [Lachnospiraceae bacterium]